MVETKGREDKDVSAKARAAIGWCKAASTKTKWEYLYVPQDVFGRFSSDKLEDLLRACAPALKRMTEEESQKQLELPFREATAAEVAGIEAFIDGNSFQSLPSRYQKAIEQAVVLFKFLEKKKDVSFSPVFTALLGPLDESAKGLILNRLLPYVPTLAQEQANFFDPYYKGLKARDESWLRKHAANLKRSLVYRNGLWPLGLLQFCLDYARTADDNVGGVFKAVRESFKEDAKTHLLETVSRMADFRNKFVAHQEAELTDGAKARGRA